MRVENPKPEIDKLRILMISTLLIISGILVISLAFFLHQNVNSEFINGSHDIVFQSRPYLEYEAQVSWETSMTGEKKPRKGSNCVISKAVWLASDIDNLAIWIKVLNHKHELVSVHLLKPTPEFLPDGSINIPVSIVTIPPDGFNDYTVIFEQTHIPSRTSFISPKYRLGFSPSSSEGNAVIPFFIGTIGSFFAILGLTVAYLLHKHIRIVKRFLPHS